MTEGKTILVIDTGGLFVAAAEELIPFFKEVFYAIPYYSCFPDVLAEKCGTGIKGLTKVSDYNDVIDKVDVVFVPDGNLSAIVNRERNKHNISVFGCGEMEWMELERWNARKEFLKLGLPQIKATKITGTNDLRDYLEDYEDKWVKLLRHRGLCETFHHINPFITEYKLRELEVALASDSDDEVFIVEDNMPGVEVGIDTYCIDGEFPEKVHLGYEIKDKAYLSVIMESAKLPEQLKKVNEAIAPAMKADKYRSVFSYEVRISEKDKTGYLTDLCLRSAFPASDIYRNTIKNFPEIIFHGAQGKMVQPEFIENCKYGVMAVIFSDTAAEGKFLPIEIPVEIQPFVKLRSYHKKSETEFEHIPMYHYSAVGTVLGWGNTLDEAIKLCQERFEKIVCPDLNNNISDLQSTGMKVIEKGKEMGIEF